MTALSSLRQKPTALARRLRALAAENHEKLDDIYVALTEAADAIDGLVVAIEPFIRNAGAVSLSSALGHIERSDLHAARDAHNKARGGS